LNLKGFPQNTQGKKRFSQATLGRPEKGKKRPRVRRGGIRGVQKLFGLQAIEEFSEI
jgi:hypothetical protein